MKKLLSIAVFAIFSATSALAISPSIGVSYNHAGFAAEGIEKNFNETGGSAIHTEEYGAFADQYGSVFVELGLNGVLSIGLDYVPGDIETPTNSSKEGGSSASGQDPGTSTVSASFQGLTTLYLKANIPFLGGTYVKAGFSEVDVSVNESIASGNTYQDVETEGYLVGLGYNHDIAGGIAIRAEVTASAYSDVETNNGKSNSANRNEVHVTNMWGAKGTISLVKSF